MSDFLKGWMIGGILTGIVVVAVGSIAAPDDESVRTRTNIRVTAGETTVWCTMTEEDGDVEFSDCAPRPRALP